jgi:predicted helicase
MPQDMDLQGEYEQGWKVTEIFGTGNPNADAGKRYSLGIVTHNDQLHIGWSQTELQERIAILADSKVSDTEALRLLPIEDSRYWQTPRERGKVRKSDWKSNIWPIYYRPFDWRHIYYEPDLMEIGRGGASRNVMLWAKKCPLNLMVSRGYEVDEFEHVLVSDRIAVHHAATRKEGNYFFPLYYYPTPDPSRLFETEGDWPPGTDGRVPNFNRAFVQDMTNRLGLRFVPDGRGNLETTYAPEDVFAYAYAVFHSPTYRERYGEFLRIDFPRLPLTSNMNLFRALVEKGTELVALHLMRSAALGHLATTYPVTGNNQVASGHPKHSEGDQRVWINQTQYFEGVPKELWEFQVGGYQVLEKWLKDRRGRTLSYDDIRHYQRIVVALKETMRLTDEIDQIIPSWPLE